ncbi:uncharacterized protein LOC125380100 [Haliotis rufescens]|uniref:uncharacterized protein LOC125380100 n=1 Tax=Haliotis rufescens TaxID=6454 RepID=UPI00201EAE04|nr:uncharacterized protein LOC125380100 [Haliotis rufescens]
MADTLFFNRPQSRYPYWVNIPPTVPKYPSSQEMFRRSVPEKYTSKVGRESYQHWTDKWYDNGEPMRRQEELPKVVDRHEPCQRPWEYRMGTSAVPKWSREGKDWPVDDRKYLRSGRPVTETMRARGMNRLSAREDNLYPFSNYMTSTYRKPVYSIYGPLQRPQVYGITHQHNQHGYMPFEDYY